MRKWSILAALGLLLACLLPSADAGQPDVQRLVNTIEEQNMKLDALSRRVAQLEAQQAGSRASIREAVRQAEANATALADLPAAPAPGLSKLAAWAEKVKFSGDLRYRHEFFDRTGRRDRNRQRIRARLQMHARPSDELDLVFRLASGSWDPVSTNQTLTGGFSSKHLWLDLACFDWHPEALAGLHMLGGKMKNPFHRPGKTELIWDSDLNPEGLALKHSWPLSETAKLFASGGGFWINENKHGADSLLYGAQAGLKLDVADGATLTLGGSFYEYNQVRGEEVFVDPEDPFGNSAVPVSAGSDEMAYTEDYRLVEAFAELGFKAGGLPISVFGDYVHNTEADSGADTGWLVGFKLGKAKKPGSWELKYNYRDLEADAVVGAFTDSDFIGGGTDGRGHEIGLGYQISKATQAGVTLFLNDLGLEEKDDYKRLQVDLKFKF